MGLVEQCKPVKFWTPYLNTVGAKMNYIINNNGNKPIDLIVKIMEKEFATVTNPSTSITRQLTRCSSLVRNICTDESFTKAEADRKEKNAKIGKDTIPCYEVKQIENTDGKEFECSYVLFKLDQSRHTVTTFNQVNEAKTNLLKLLVRGTVTFTYIDNKNAIVNVLSTTLSKEWLMKNRNITEQDYIDLIRNCWDFNRAFTLTLPVIFGSDDKIKTVDICMPCITFTVFHGNGKK